MSIYARRDDGGMRSGREEAAAGGSNFGPTRRLATSDERGVIGHRSSSVIGHSAENQVDSFDSIMLTSFNVQCCLFAPLFHRDEKTASNNTPQPIHLTLSHTLDIFTE